MFYENGTYRWGGAPQSRGTRYWKIEDRILYWRGTGLGGREDFGRFFGEGNFSDGELEVEKQIIDGISRALVQDLLEEA